MLLITSPLSSIFLFSSLEPIIRCYLSVFIFIWLFKNHSSSFSTHIWSLLRSTSRFLSQTYGVLSSAYAAKLTSFCSKNVSNVFILKNKDPSMDPWDTQYSIFDHDRAYFNGSVSITSKDLPLPVQSQFL